MRASIIGGLLAAALMSTTAFSQSATQGNSTTPAATPPAASTTTTGSTSATTPSTMSGQWRASKLMGLDIYNEQNEKLGDISEILMDQSGKVTGYVIGVGGFLGMGERDIMVEPSKVKFVEEPVRTSATSATRDTAATANASADRPRAGAATTGTTGTSAAATARNNGNDWAPDHGVLAGASKDQLKSMPEFKYDNSASR